MPRYRIKHGSLIKARTILAVGDVVELSAAEARDIDAAGETLELLPEAPAVAAVPVVPVNHPSAPSVVEAPVVPTPEAAPRRRKEKHT